MTCECNLCKRSRAVDKFTENLNPEIKQFISEMFNDLQHAEFDRDWYHHKYQLSCLKNNLLTYGKPENYIQCPHCKKIAFYIMQGIENRRNLHFKPLRDIDTLKCLNCGMELKLDEVTENLKPSDLTKYYENL